MVTSTRLLSGLVLTLGLAVTHAVDTDNGEEYDENPDDGPDDHRHPQHWSYVGTGNGLSKWATLYHTCGNGTRQSPINIITKSAVYDDSLDTIQFNIDKHSPATAAIFNNGHTVGISFTPTIRLSGGNLGDRYKMHSAHFHWGKTDTNGSEHTVNGRRFPFVMHIVNYDDEKYNTIDDALAQPRGLAVVGVLFEISSSDNTQLAPLISALNNITTPHGDEVVIQLPLTALLPTNLDQYYRYSGSLTTPGCFESVVWTVMKNYQRISSRQVAEFRKLQATMSDASHANPAEQQSLTPNWRPVQSLNGRTVYSSFTSSAQSSTDSGTAHQVRQLSVLELAVVTVITAAVLLLRL